MAQSRMAVLVVTLAVVLSPGCQPQPDRSAITASIEAMLPALEEKGQTWSADTYVQHPLPDIAELDSILFDPFSKHEPWANPANKPLQDNLLAALNAWEAGLGSAPTVPSPDRSQASRALQGAVSAYVARSRIELGRGEPELAVRDAAQAIKVAGEAMAGAPSEFFAACAPAVLIALEHGIGLAKSPKVGPEGLDALLRSVPTQMVAVAGHNSGGRAHSFKHLLVSLRDATDPAETATRAIRPLGEPSAVTAALRHMLARQDLPIGSDQLKAHIDRAVAEWGGGSSTRLDQAIQADAGRTATLARIWGFDPVRADYSDQAWVERTRVQDPNAVLWLVLAVWMGGTLSDFESAAAVDIAITRLTMRVLAETHRIAKGRYPAKVGDLGDNPLLGCLDANPLSSRRLGVDFGSMRLVPAKEDMELVGRLSLETAF